jgi:hypothetical protein
LFLLRNNSFNFGQYWKSLRDSIWLTVRASTSRFGMSFMTWISFRSLPQRLSFVIEFKGYRVFITKNYYVRAIPFF